MNKNVIIKKMENENKKETSSENVRATNNLSGDAQNKILTDKINSQNKEIKTMKEIIEEQRKATLMLDETLKNMSDQFKNNKVKKITNEPYVWTQINKYINR